MLVLLGVLVLLVQGGVWVDAQAQIAAQGDAPRTARPASPPASPVTPTTAPPAPSPPAVTIPVLNRDAATSGADARFLFLSFDPFGAACS
jgi:hypothetical protein